MDDLLKDETFLARWLAGELSEVELTRFEQHPDFDFYQRMLTSTEGLQVEQPDQESLLKKIRQAKKKGQGAEIRRQRSVVRRRLFIYSAAAAVTALVIGYFVFMSPDTQKIRSLAEQQINHTLPDGSSVLLNPNSELVYAANTFKKNRQLQLNGQAFFEVQEGESFQVETSNGKVEVLGTSFSVFSNNEKFVVACKTGRVKVSDQSGQDVILNIGERVRTRSKKLETKELIDPLAIGNWQDSISRFESEKLYLVVQAIENQFGVKINIPESMREEKFTGIFLHKDVNTAMNMVFDAMGMEYEESKDGIFTARIKK